MHARTFRTLALCLSIGMAARPGSSAATPATERWGCWETSLAGPSGGNPYLEVTFSADFTRADTTLAITGFYDGDGQYRLRFSPPATGDWNYITHSNRPELDGKRGTLTATTPTAGNHGPVQVFQTYYFRHADGTAYHPFGTTCYAWVHQTGELQQQTLRTLASSPFNKIRFCVFPKDYHYNKNEPDRCAFQKGADGKFDFNRPDPLFWRHFEQRVLDLQKLAIEADIILWHPYDRWGFASMGKDEDDRYLRYCIARLSAYRNVWWSLANEYDFMTKPKAKTGNKEWGDWDRFFSVLENEDPFHRLRGIHNGTVFYDHTKPWVTHASVQSSDLNRGITLRATWHKPVVYDECKYEGNIPENWGHLGARDMTRRFWLGTLGGCYVGHGETYLHPQDILWWSKGGVLHGESPERIRWLRDFMAQAPPFDQLQPAGDAAGRYVLRIPGKYYLLYCLDTAPRQIELQGTGTYRVDVIDPWEMTVTPAGSAPAGTFTVTPPKPDLAYRFTATGPPAPAGH